MYLTNSVYHNIFDFYFFLIPLITICTNMLYGYLLFGFENPKRAMFSYFMFL